MKTIHMGGIFFPRPYQLTLALLAATILAVSGQDAALNANITLSPTPISIQPLSLTVDDMLEVKSLSDDQLSAFVSSLNVTPTISFDALPRHGIGQTYFSLQHPDWPPLPGDTAAVPVWQMDGFLLLNDLNFDYSPPVARHMRTSFSAPLPGGGSGDGGTNTPNDNVTVLPSYGTNLWIAQPGISSGNLTGVISNSQADVLYEIQSKQDLPQSIWVSEGFVYGSEITNWTAMAVAQANRTNLFLRIRSWLDSNNSGIPDWWWLQYFGQVTNVDAAVSIPGDGYSNYQKFQLGLNPINYYNPNAPSGFFGSLDISGTNVVLEWNPSPGPATYLIQRGIYHTNTSAYTYSQIATLNSNTIFFKDTGAVSNANAFNNIYSIAATYPGGNLTATDSWQVSWYRDIGNEGPPYGPPLPGNVYAYAKSTGTNVIISWSPAPGPATNYVIFRAAYNPTNATYSYAQIATVSTNTTYFQDTGAIKKPTDWYNFYEVQAGYIGGGLSQPATTTISTTAQSPSGISAIVDATGTNVFVSWTPPNGLTVSNYVIFRGVYSTNIGDYVYSQIGKVSASTTTFEDVGAITNNNNLNDIYEVEAGLFNGDLSGFDTAYLTLPIPPPVPSFHIRVTTQLVRGPMGRWQLVFSSIPANVQSFQLTWGLYSVDSDNDVGIAHIKTISKNAITNGVYSILDSDITNDNDAFNVLYNDSTPHLFVQAIATNGDMGDSMETGFVNNDAGYFVDGRTQLKQNLLFKLRAATMSQSCTVSGTTYDPMFFDYAGRFIVPADTNYVESSLYHWAYQFKQYGNPAPHFIKMSDLWPFDVNYQLHQRLNDPSHPSVPSSFTWTNNFVNPPAAAVLGISDPYWISQGLNNLADVAAYTNSGNLYLNSGMKNLFGLSFAAALVNQSPQITVSPGSSVNMTNVNVFYNQTADPVLQTNGYYFARINTPGATLTGDVAQDQNQPYPIPVNPGFAATNQTGLMIGSVGTPTVIGAWAKYSVSGSSPAKYAYLGQYFVTNAFLLSTNGTPTTNSAGIVSPYGEFFPTQAGQAALVTMPDIDTGQQATGVVKIISINADANHDGKMDLTYFSEDQTSTSHPLRFWVNDDSDSGDFGGDGVPGKTGVQGDGNNYANQYGYGNDFDNNGLPVYKVHGTRDLVDFFPVYLNIGGLFQSNSVSSGISLTDTNYQFVLSQADSVLRFVYTDLTPTNYMNYLHDTNESQSLAYAVTTTITPGGVTLSNSFLNGIATANHGVILVEAAASTTQPLVLSIYHGSNLLAQTSMYLSISGVEQMFRSKTMLLYSQSGTVPDRLTDSDVPNEPDTIDKNFIFLHGYNVNPNQARGWNADIYKRLYWSGSHAKFYGVTWSASDSQIAGQVTINLQTNIVHAFNTAPLLNTFLNSLSGTNIVAAHSLGNMAVLSTLNDYANQSINTYFMVDAAVGIEAIDSGASSNPDMYPTAWTNYAGKLWASDWYALFPTNDYRSTLTWRGRLSNLQNANVYNFYSSGEEVLRDYPSDPPVNLLSIAYGQGMGVYRGATGVDTWAWQEKLKGLLLVGDNLLSSSHGGWKFAYAYYSNNIVMPNSQATLLPDSQLRTNAFFEVTSSSFGNADLALFGASGSAYAQTNRNRILSDAIPCLTLPVGANHVGRLAPSGQPDQNFDMQTDYENGWPLGRHQPQYPIGTSAAGEWHHSDVRAVAYTFTYQLFNQMVTVGNLK